MDVQPENEGNYVKNDAETVVSADLTNQETVPTTDNGSETILADTVASDPDEEILESVRADGEDTAASGSEENLRNDLDVEIGSANENQTAHEESVVFDNNSTGEDGPPRLHLETPDKETASPHEEEVKAEEEEHTPAEEISYEEYTKLLQELCEQRDKAIQRSRQLQGKLVEYFRKKGGVDVQVETEKQVPELLQEYERYMDMLTELKQQINTETEIAEQQEEELRVQSQEKLDKVKNEWRAFMALKQDVAVSVLSRLLGKQAAQAKVESSLAAEQLHQDELIKLRLKHLNLRVKVNRLEAELRHEDEQRDPLQLQFERLQAQQLEQRRRTEKQNEESVKMQKKISSSLEVLSSVKEKLSWSQMEVQTKKEQLAEVEATLARKRELLTRMKKARNNLQIENLRLKERCGLRGNRALLLDFEDTVEASDLLEEKLEGLKLRLSVAGGGKRWRQIDQ
ncbi:coiled-coil domain-containing protein 96 [Cheilinus undulatus]|uniref:coiled-coil domain-containing protein 96 n=1 Tax=Cheilinus undulatus TaxID=241271 RepID=UPI001BD4AE52|nr:coiled-coil domain-containing protein 96 [Cheilinus undulatus]XP_041635516.1 coiled-coil domain-containing protein 96 [Cheilinus undulatus]